MFAHHGVSGYAAGKKESITGIVTDFQFINPHAIIYMDARDDKGNVLHW